MVGVPRRWLIAITAVAIEIGAFVAWRLAGHRHGATPRAGSETR